MMTIDAATIAPVLQRLGMLPQRAAAIQQREIQSLGRRYLAQFEAETPQGHGATRGGLRGAYRVTESYSATDASYRITNTTPYLKWVVSGRGPVEAKAAKVLRFEIDGNVFFRRRVGPAAPNPFPARTARAMEPYIAQTRAALPGLIVRSYGA